MPTIIPVFLLKKLYVKGSFENSANGFEFSLKNTLAPGTLIGMATVQIDGRDIPLEKLWISTGDSPPIRASEITRDKPRAFPMNIEIKFRVENNPLAPGSHHVRVQVNTKEAGELKIDAEDTIV